jgi:hypothetical protein
VKSTLLRSLEKLLEMVLPARAASTPDPQDDADLSDEALLDPTLRLAVRVVSAWARVNQVPLPRMWIVASAKRCPASGQVRSEIHWAIKFLFTQVRDDHGVMLDQAYRFKLELAVATANRAWYLIETKDADEEVDSEPVVSTYAVMFDPSLGTTPQA